MSGTVSSGLWAALKTREILELSIRTFMRFTNSNIVNFDSWQLCEEACFRVKRFTEPSSSHSRIDTNTVVIRISRIQSLGDFVTQCQPPFADHATGKVNEKQIKTDHLILINRF